MAGLVERALVPGGDAAGRDPATGEPTARVHAWRGAVLISLASASLIGLGAQGRMQQGGDMLVEWIGTPFSGDAPSTLIFLGLVTPLALPPNWGGAGQAIAAGPARRDAGSFVNAGLLRGLVLLVLLGRTFSGSDALLDVGLVIVVLLAPVLALTWQATARRPLPGALGLRRPGPPASGIASIASELRPGRPIGLSVVGLALAGAGAGARAGPHHPRAGPASQGSASPGPRARLPQRLRLRACSACSRSWPCRARCSSRGAPAASRPCPPTVPRPRPSPSRSSRGRSPSSSPSRSCASGVLQPRPRWAATSRGAAPRAPLAMALALAFAAGER